MKWLRELLKKFTTRGEAELDVARHRIPATPLPQLPNGRKLDLDHLGQSIGYNIRSAELFTQALVHRSYLQQTNQQGQSNERLEFLGDSILNLIVGEYLYRTTPLADEGEMTKVRSRLVNRKALVAYSKNIKLFDFILMSPSAQASMGKGAETIVADTFEAIIAAIYLDGGYAEAKRFVEKQLAHALHEKTIIVHDENYKSQLLEHAQANGLGVPRYTILKEEGPDHDRTFTVEVTMSGKKHGIGTGKNKKEAEQAAARKALERVRE
jgi:ribonuclease-3